MKNPDHEDGRYLTPNENELRFVERETPDGTVRILQQYLWSYKANEWGWYDVPLETE